MYNEVICSCVPNVPVCIGFSKNGQKRKICGNHFHDEIELLAVKRGMMSCTSGKNTFEITSGSILFINSRIPHHTAYLEDGTSMVLIQLGVYELQQNNMGKYLSRFVNSGDNSMLLFNRGLSVTSELWQYINKVKDEYINKSPAYETFIKANLYNILAVMYRNNVLKNVESFFDMKTVDKIAPALAYIDEHYQDNITLEQISATAHLNPSYFCRLFKKTTNSTFMEYLNFVRVCHAEKLLSKTSKSVLEISLETGFSSTSYFTTVFRRLKNCTPTAYRKIKYAQN